MNKFLAHQYNEELKNIREIKKGLVIIRHTIQTHKNLTVEQKDKLSQSIMGINEMLMALIQDDAELFTIRENDEELNKELLEITDIIYQIQSTAVNVENVHTFVLGLTSGLIGDYATNIHAKREMTEFKKNMKHILPNMQDMLILNVLYENDIADTKEIAHKTKLQFDFVKKELDILEEKNCVIKGEQKNPIYALSVVGRTYMNEIVHLF